MDAAASAALLADVETLMWALTWPSIVAGFLLGCMAGPSLLRGLGWCMQPITTRLLRRFGVECPECYGCGRVHPLDEREA